MSQTKFPLRPTRLLLRRNMLLLVSLFWLAAGLATLAAARPTPPRPQAAGARHPRHNPTRPTRTRTRRRTAARHERSEAYAQGEAGQEVDEASGEVVERRTDWFLFQRAYPFTEPPAGARQRAWAERPFARGDFYGLSPNGLALQTAPTWRHIGPAPTTSAFPNNWGLTSGRINTIAIKPDDPRVVLVGASTGGIWRSLDGGASFAPVSDTQVDLSVSTIAFSRSNPAVVYAGMGDLYGGYLGTGVLRSTDAGATWTRVSNASLPAPGMSAKLEVDPTNSNHVYLALFARYNGNANNQLNAGGLYVSNDGGGNWTRQFAGLPRDLAINPINPANIFLAAVRADAPNTGTAGVFRSADGGNSWTQVYTAPFGAYPQTADVRVAIAATAPLTVYVYSGTGGSTGSLRLDVSLDGGLSWSSRGALTGVDAGQFGYNTYLAVDPLNPLGVYVGGRDVFRSLDGGLTWTNLTRNFAAPYTCGSCYQPTNATTHPDQHAIAFAPNDPLTLYIGNDGGLWKSSNGGASFQTLNATLMLAQFVGLAMHPTNPAISYGGTQDNGSQFRSADGRGWQEYATGDGGQTLVNPVDPTVVFSTYIYGSISRWRFNANGSRTREISTGNSTFGEPDSNARISFYPPLTGNGADPTLYFGTWRLFTSANLGTSWFAPGGPTDLTKGPGDGTPANRPDVLEAIGVERRAGAQVIYTGSAQGRAMVTGNGGQTWTDVTAGLPNRTITSIVVDPQNPAVAYLTVSGYGSGHVFKTNTMGQSWADISGPAGGGGLPNAPVNALLIDPLTPTIIYAATDVGVYRAPSAGGAWESFNQGLPPTVGMAFATNASGQIQLGTYGRGAYELLGNTGAGGGGPIQFSAAGYSVGEGAGRALISVTRTDASAAATVVFATVDDPAAVPCDPNASNNGQPFPRGTAYARCDYATTVDTINFAPGETQQQIAVPLIDDVFVEGNETVQLRLSDATGATLGAQTTATLTLVDNDAAGQANPIFATPFFVRQQYLDFLSREPEAGEPWSGVLNRCADPNNTDPNSASANCDRITVSASFFGSPEFQLKGFYVFLFYKVAYGRDVLPAYDQIVPDMRSVSGASETETFNKRALFAQGFTQRPEFKGLYDAQTNSNFVAALLGRYGLGSIYTPDPAQPDGKSYITLSQTDLVTRLNTNALTRAQVLRAVVQSNEVGAAEFNGAFVAMQYYGYLRRTPEAAGYQAWLNYLSAHPQDFRTMINGFMNSQEYRLRFGP